MSKISESEELSRGDYEAIIINPLNPQYSVAVEYFRENLAATVWDIPEDIYKEVKRWAIGLYPGNEITNYIIELNYYIEYDDCQTVAVLYNGNWFRDWEQ